MKQLKITVNGKTYDVSVEEVSASSDVKVAAPVKEATPVQPVTPAANVNGETINAPMPGNIIKILVSAGASVKKGDVLIVFEAMKMENEICAPRDGVVEAVLVSQGETFDSGKALLSLK